MNLGFTVFFDVKQFTRHSIRQQVATLGIETVYCVILPDDKIRTQVSELF